MRMGIVVVMFVAAQGVAAQAQGTADAALAAYRLTMPNVRKMAAAYERLDAVLQADPALARRMEGAEASSAEDLVTKLDREPAVHQAIVAAGITTRDLVLTQLATLTTAITDFAVRSGAKPPAAAAAAANLRVYQENRAEFDEITVRLKALASWQAMQAGDKGDADED